MGSDSDLPTMQGAIVVCEEFGVKSKLRLSLPTAPRADGGICSPTSAASGDYAGAGGAAHLPGMVASLTHFPLLASQYPVVTYKG